MLRKITLSLLLLVSLGIMLPLAGSLAHGLRQSIEMSSSRQHRRHSHAWWRRHRARVRMRRAAALARRNAILNASLLNTSATDATSGSIPALPNGWAHAGGNSELRSKVTNPTSALPGSMAVSVVALSRPNPTFLTAREEKRMLAGVAVTDLRRIVIDKMMVSGGWVTNDFVREVNGARVFVVTAQTPRDANSPEKTWNFYFTEAGGRIYGLTTNAPVGSADRMATEAERYIGTLRSTSATQTAPDKR
jgi:hypothetical protein